MPSLHLTNSQIDIIVREWQVYHVDKDVEEITKSFLCNTNDENAAVECDWKVLEDFISKEQELWNKVESELDESEKPVLDGLEIEIKLPKFILEEMSVSEKEIYSSLKKQRKVSIIGSVQICIILLKYFSRIVKEGDFSKIKGVSIDDVTVMEECMTDLKSLNAKLCSEVLPSTIRHVEKLQESLGTANASGEFANFSQEFMSQAKVTNSECINKESVLNVTERLIKAPEKELTKCDTFLNESVDEKEFMLRLPKSEEQFPFNVLPPQITSSVSGIESTNNYLFKKIAETSVFSPTSTFSPTSIFSPASALPGVEINEEVSSSSEKTDCSLNLAVPFSPLISDGRKSHLAAEGCKMNESGLSEDLNSMTLPNVSLLD
ncbi:uncharacterized protein LOC129225003 [Uloborus diversus]|uniref:uncharacterized protein LOC129225003 n=1 Tax=Uloborus diversus TaxID=327109 RepID=UPI0024097B4E|nr:uncharacterized protein LOC129225003 [Uloborus diversus]